MYRRLRMKSSHFLIRLGVYWKMANLKSERGVKWKKWNSIFILRIVKWRCLFHILNYIPIILINLILLFPVSNHSGGTSSLWVIKYRNINAIVSLELWGWAYVCNWSRVVGEGCGTIIAKKINLTLSSQSVIPNFKAEESKSKIKQPKIESYEFSFNEVSCDDLTLLCGHQQSRIWIFIKEI